MKNKIIISCMILFCTIHVAKPQTNYVTVSSGDWSSSNIWDPSGTPGASDNVTIKSGHSVTGGRNVNNITIQSGASLSYQSARTISGNLTIGGTLTSSITLTVNGNIIVTGNCTVNVNTLNVKGSSISGNGDITVNGIFQLGGTNQTFTNNLNGKLITSYLSINSGNSFIQGTNSHLVLTNNFVNNGTFNASATENTVEYALNQDNRTILATTYYNLKFSGTYTASFPTSNITIKGDLIHDSGMNASNSTITFDGTDCEIKGNASTFTLNNITINNGAKLILPGSNKTFNLNGNLENNGTLDHNNGTITFNGTTTISGSSPSTFNNIIINSGKTLTSHSSTMNIYGNFTNNGTFNSNGGTIVFNGNSTISGTSTTTFNNITITGTLTSISGTLQISGNFTDNGTFNHNNGTIVFNSGGTSQIGGNSTTIFNNLTIESTTIDVVPNKKITINGTLLNNNGTLRLNDDGSSLTSSLITNGNITGSGNYEVELYFPTERWFYVSSPINGALSNVFDPTNSNVGLFTYNTTSNVYTQITTENVPLETMTGYAIKYRNSYGPKTVTFAGSSIHTGEKSFNAVGEGSGKGWNLAGNPYPSAVDWKSSSITRTNIAPYIYYRTNSTWASYNAQTNEGTNGGQRYIPAMQGIWIKVFGTSGTLTFNNNCRIHSSQEFYKPVQNTVPDFPQIRIKIQNTENNNFDETVLNFRNEEVNPSENLDDYDIEKFIAPEPEMPQIYLTDNKDQYFAINQVPYSTLEKNKKFELGFTSGINGKFKIIPSLFNIPIDIDVILIDKATKKEYDLKKVKEIEFSSGKATYNNRFSIILQNKQNDASLNDNNLDFNSIYEGFFNIENIQFVNNILKATINNYTENNMCSIEITDLVGNTIFKQQFEAYKTVQKTFNINNIPAPGMYLIKFSNQNIHNISKLLITN